MSGIFNPDTPSVTVAAPPPTIDDATARRQASDQALRRRGAIASLLTGPEGIKAPEVATKTLLGS